MQFMGKILVAVAVAINLGINSVVQADEVLLFDDFNNAVLDTAKWEEGQWTLGRTVFGNPVTFGAEVGRASCPCR